MILQACRPTLFLEGSCRRFIVSWNRESEQRTTESLTLSSSKKPKNYRLSLFLPNSGAVLAQTLGFRVQSIPQKCKKMGAHDAFYHIYRFLSKMLKINVQDFSNPSLSMCFWIKTSDHSALNKLFLRWPWLVIFTQKTRKALEFFQNSQLLVH